MKRSQVHFHLHGHHTLQRRKKNSSFYFCLSKCKMIHSCTAYIITSSSSSFVIVIIISRGKETIKLVKTMKRATVSCNVIQQVLCLHHGPYGTRTSDSAETPSPNLQPSDVTQSSNHLGFILILPF